MVASLTSVESYQAQRSLSRRAWRNDVYEELYAAGLDSIADRFISCKENHFTRVKPHPAAALPPAAESVWVCIADNNHEIEIYAQTCDLRICPDCTRRHAARLVQRFLPKFEELLHLHHKRFRFRHIVFTSSAGLESDGVRATFEAGFKSVYNVMDSMMPRDWKSGQGFLVGAEFGEAGHKLHYHVIHWGQYLDQAALSQRWKAESPGADYVVRVYGFPYRGKTIEETLREVLKYCVKFHSRDNATGESKYIEPRLVPALAKVLEGTRRVRAYGVFYNLPEEPHPHLCATCGAEMMAIPRDYFVTYCNTGYLPQEWARLMQTGSLSLITADNSSPGNRPNAPPEGKQMSFSSLSENQKAAWRKRDFGW